MKKLLSLLSILTISGTAVPTTIAASSYQKEEQLNNNINQQKDNLKTLNRSKRDFLGIGKWVSNAVEDVINWTKTAIIDGINWTMTAVKDGANWTVTAVS